MSGNNEMIEINTKYKLHESYLDDVVIEVSQDSSWRKKLFGGQYNEKFLITYDEMSEIPWYLREAFKQYRLEYYVSKTQFCPEDFDEDLVIFKFEAKEFSDLVRYSGNNEKVFNC